MWYYSEIWNFSYRKPQLQSIYSMKNTGYLLYFYESGFSFKNVRIMRYFNEILNGITLVCVHFGEITRCAEAVALRVTHVLQSTTHRVSRKGHPDF